MAQQFISASYARTFKHASTAIALGTSSTYYLFHARDEPFTKSEATPTASPDIDTEPNQSHVGIIKTDFTDKLAAKPYLNYHNPYARHGIMTSTINTGKKLWGKFARSDRDAVITGDSWNEEKVSGALAGKRLERPKGVPRRVRILAIDVPEFREVFDGECRVNLSRVYPDDIAPAKYIPRKTRASANENGNGRGEKKTSSAKEEMEKIEIVQKSLARSLVRCRNEKSKRIGVELLEASVYDLNPNNMRRTYQFGKYKYDPGKYGSARDGPGDMLQRRMSVSPSGSGLNIRRKGKDVVTVTMNGGEIKQTNDDEIGVADVEESIQDGDLQEGSNTDAEMTVLAEEEDEVDAPWHQSAWIEEMQIRINGSIPFGANVERSSWLTRTLFGNCYRQTVKPSRSFLQWFIPSFLSGEKVGGEDGIDGDYGRDGRTINRASSKPHAVIADGSAIQRVPGSLRYLTKCCKEAGVPLFIINDPRVWGGNTNKDIESAAKDIRKRIKARIVSNALTIKEGSMFERGRILGKLETEAKWQLKDAGRRTRQAVTDAKARLQKERDEDWSGLGGKELMQKLVEKKLVSIHGSRLVDTSVSKAFGELCKEYMTHAELQSMPASTSTSTSNLSDSKSDTHSDAALPTTPVEQQGLEQEEQS